MRPMPVRPGRDRRRTPAAHRRPHIRSEHPAALARPGRRPGRLPPSRRRHKTDPHRHHRLWARTGTARPRLVLRHPDSQHPARPTTDTAMTAGMKLRVDPIACDGRKLCAEILPELITLDDWGFPIIRDTDVPDHLLDEAREAVRVCPKLALRLEGPINTR